MSSLKERTRVGLLWGGVNTVVQQLVGVCFGIVLARLLSQGDYGMMAMIGVFSLVASALQNSGFSMALVNQSCVSEEDYNAVFWFNITVSTGIYIVLFFCAPLIALFYATPELTPLCRYAFLGFVIASFGTAHNAWLTKHLLTKRLAQGAMTAVVVSSTVGCVMAYCGCGYWSLATQSIVYVAVNTVFLWCYSGFVPRLRGLSMTPIRGMWTFASKILFTAIATIINNNVLNILLGRLYGSVATGVYNQAYQWNFKASSVVQNMVNGVAQPVLVDVRTDEGREVRVLRKLMRFTAFISFPLMLGLCIVSKEFIVVAIGAKWLSSVVLLRILCCAGAVAALSLLLSNVVISAGKSTVYLCVTVALGIAQIVLLIALHSYGLTVMVTAYTALNVFWLFVWHYVASRLICYRLVMFLRDIVPYGGAAALVGVVTVVITLGINTLWLLLLTRVIVFAILYYVLLKCCHSVILAESEAFIIKKLRR